MFGCRAIGNLFDLDVQVLGDVAGDCMSCVSDSSLALRIELATYRSTLIDWRDANSFNVSLKIVGSNPNASKDFVS